jgi:DNA-binding transcriptional regulator YiaG
MDSREILIKAQKATGMTQKAFAEYFGIPVRTLQDWIAGKRKMPDYLLRLMIYKLEVEKKLVGLSKELDE